MWNQTPVSSLSCVLVWAYHNEVIMAANGQQIQGSTQRPAGSHSMAEVQSSVEKPAKVEEINRQRYCPWWYVHSLMVCIPNEPEDKIFLTFHWIYIGAMHECCTWPWLNLNKICFEYSKRKKKYVLLSLYSFNLSFPNCLLIIKTGFSGNLEGKMCWGFTSRQLRKDGLHAHTHTHGWWSSKTLRP